MSRLQVWIATIIAVALSVWLHGAEDWHLPAVYFSGMALLAHWLVNHVKFIKG